MKFWQVSSKIFIFALAFLLGLNAPSSEAAKILVMSPALSNSIVMLSGRVADTLVEAGHNVTFWIPEMTTWASGINGTRLAQQVIRMHNLSDSFERAVKSIGGGDQFEERRISAFAYQRAQHDSLADFCESMLERKSELEMLKRENFDLAISDMPDVCYLGIAHHLGIRSHIWISTGQIYESFGFHLGIPKPISYAPALEDTLLSPRMTLWERFHNAYMHLIAHISYASTYSKENEMFRRLVSPDFPNHQMLIKEVSICFAVADEFINPALPTLSKVVYIGGIGLEKVNPLPEKLLKIVNSGSQGSVLFSFGSAAYTSSLNPVKKRAIFDAFKAFPEYSFIVKISSDDESSRNFSKDLSNVHLVEWVPQTDLLAHPNLKLFISHGGSNSVLESAIRGVPMLIIPLFFDQFQNAKGAEYRGFARTLPKGQITRQKFQNLVDEMLNNETYKITALRLAKLHREKPNKPAESIVKWTNFVLENGPLPELIPEGASMSIIAYFSLDLIFITIVLLFAVIQLARWTLRRSSELIWSRKSKGKKLPAKKKKIQ